MQSEENRAAGGGKEREGASAWRYGPPERDKQIGRYAEIAGQAFNVAAEEIEPKIRGLGAKMVRLLHDGRQVAGGAVLFWMGQWFGGRTVPMTGVAAVAVSPGMRSRGLAAHLMRSILMEIHTKEVPLSTLYPAVTSLYRQAGYETAGARYELRLLPRTFELRERALEVRELGEKDLPRTLALYAERVQGANGPIDRSAADWQKFLGVWRGPMCRHGVWNGERLEGYIVYFPRLRDGALYVREFVAATPAAGRRLLAFLGAHRTQTEACVLSSYPADPILAGLQPFSDQLRIPSHWMLRIVDVKRALEGRGYPPAVRAAVTLEIRDDVLAHNTGRFRLEVAGGKAAVRRLRSSAGAEARDALTLDIRGLAALYSAHMQAREMARLTPYLDASSPQLAALEGIFSGPGPYMQDEF